MGGHINYAVKRFIEIWFFLMAIMQFLWTKSRLKIKHFLIQSLVMKFSYMYFKLLLFSADWINNEKFFY